MKSLILLSAILFTSFFFSQENDIDHIKLKVIISEQSLPGANIYFEGMEQNEVLTTDFDGTKFLELHKNINSLRLNFMGLIVNIKVIRPVDSILVYLDKKRRLRVKEY